MKKETEQTLVALMWFLIAIIWGILAIFKYTKYFWYSATIILIIWWLKVNLF